MRGVIGPSSAQSIDGTNSDTTGFLHVNRQIAEGTGKPGNVHVYVSSVGGSGTRSQKQRMVIYSGDAAPVTLQAVTDEITVDQTTATGQWVTFAATYTNYGTPGTLTAGQAYWIGWWSGTQVNSGILVYSYSQLALPNAANPAGVSVANDTLSTYSPTGNPPNVPSSFGNPGRIYLVYFDIGDGSAMPGSVVQAPAGTVPTVLASGNEYEVQDDLPEYNVNRF